MGSITQDTRVTLRAVVGIVVVTASAVLAYADLKHEFRDLKATVSRGMVDRWTKTDDELHMRAFAVQNGLSPVIHEAVRLMPAVVED